MRYPVVAWVRVCRVVCLREDGTALVAAGKTAPATGDVSTLARKKPSGIVGSSDR